jgi:hypothetical protein
VRVYLPATLPMLEEWIAAGEATPRDPHEGASAYAVTPSLREWYHDADLDELEHAATQDASVGSLELLAGAASAVLRRVVLAVDIDDQLVRPDPQQGRAAVTLAGPLPVARWASALIDDPGAESVVTAAVAALQPAAAGDDDAQFALDTAEAHELGWYAVQELRDLLA